MQVVIAGIVTNGNHHYVQCLFIAYYKMQSANKRCLLYCPETKQHFFYSLSKLKENGKSTELGSRMLGQ